MLTDAAIEFFDDAAPELADAIETIVDPSYQIDVESFLHDASDWFGDVTADPPALDQIDAITGKFAFFEDRYFLI